jgi:hypothetical protein
MAEQMRAHEGVNAVRPDQQAGFGEGTILKLGAHHAAATCAAINAKIPEEDIVLDPANPIGSARALLDAIFTHTDGYKRFRKLHRHRGAFWQWTGSYYRLADEETIRPEFWTYLEKAFRLEKMKEDK